MLEKYSKILGNAPDDQTFKTAYDDIRNLRELRDSLISIGKHFYDEFITAEENHFANWIENVFGDEQLAVALRNTKSYGRTVKTLNNRIKYLELWLIFNGDKELITRYMVNGPFSQRKLIKAVMYEPEHHKFETVHGYHKSVKEQKQITYKKKSFIERFLFFKK